MRNRVIAGLGNPDKEHQGNRHNIGFMAVDRLMQDYNATAPTVKFGGHLSTADLDGDKLFFFKPMRYMNRSGGPIRELCQFYKIDADDVIILHDELDLTPAKLRIKKGGGHGGHNGLRDIDSQIGKEYIRIRMGIGHPGHKDMVSSYVLSDFSKSEWPDIELLIQETSRHFPLLLKGDESGFMNKVTLATT